MIVRVFGVVSVIGVVFGVVFGVGIRYWMWTAAVGAARVCLCLCL